MIKRKGLAQIPLMIGLLIMAVAVPVATKLVQESQDTRNQAASCGTSGTISQCGSKGGCATGYRCLPNGCSYDPACGGFVPTNTPRPTATPTKRPTATPTKRPPTPTPNPCSVSTERPNNCTCTYSNQCESGYCAGGTVCLPKPTSTPTKRPTATPTKPPSYTCLNISNQFCTTGSCSSSGATAGSGTCPSGQTCCKPGYVWDTPTPTKKPTSTPNPSSCSASKLYQCGSVSFTGCPVGYRCMLSGSYYCKYDSSCPGGPTNTPKPTVTPTSRPTSIPCATTGQSCTTRSCCTTADVCTDEGLSYPVCVPRNQIPTYIPIPTIDCAKSGQGCSTRPCCEPYLDVCTDEGLSYPKCVPRNQIPTYIPIPTMMPCAKTGNSCSSTLGCCAMTDKCTNGKCIATVPTGTNPTGTNPTSGPIIPTTKPPVGDKCPGAQACPNPSNKNLLQNCTPPDSDGTPNDTLCTKAGVIEPCGGKNYCCPSAGGAWTTDMTKCKDSPIPTDKPIVCTQCPGKPQAKLKGDADCDGEITINDYQIWIDEFRQGNYGEFNKNTWRSDFDCDGLVSLNDYQIWIDNFKIIQ